MEDGLLQGSAKCLAESTAFPFLGRGLLQWEGCFRLEMVHLFSRTVPGM